MDSFSFSSNWSRRTAFGACFLASAFLAGASLAAPEICGCEKRGKYTWAEHLTLYSNMVYYVQQAREGYAKALEASRAARGDWDALGKECDLASDKKTEIEESADEGRELQSQIANYAARENWKAIGQLSSKTGDYLEKVEKQKKDWKELDVGAFTENLGSKVREEERHWSAFFDCGKRFEGWYDKVDRTYYTAVSLPCLKREYEALKPLKEELGLAEQTLRKGREEASDLRQSLVKMRAAADTAFKNCDSWRAGIAQALTLPHDAGDDVILAKMKELSVEKIRIRFRNVKDPIDSLELKSGVEELTEPERPFVSDGPKFLYWKERSKEGKFEEWNTKISRNLELEAAWGYEIHVAGFDSPLTFPVDRWDESLPCSRVLASEQLKECARKLKAAKGVGSVFKGWANAAEPTTPLSEKSSYVKTGTTLQPIWETAVYLVTFVVPGGTPPPVIKWEYTEEGPFPVPPKLPENGNDGFSYVRWSLEENGDEAWTGGVAITNNITVYAVREADYRVVFHDEDGTPLKTLGVKKGEEFIVPNGIVLKSFKAGNSPLEKGRVFSNLWRLQGQGTNNTFKGGILTGNVNVYAVYRDETVEDVVRRNVRPVEEKASLPIVAVADATLLVVFVILLLTGGGGTRKHKATDEVAPAEGDADVASAAEAAPAGEGEQNGGADSVA